jgi:hypothetical protein
MASTVPMIHRFFDFFFSGAAPKAKVAFPFAQAFIASKRT